MAHAGSVRVGVPARTIPPEQDIPEFTLKAVLLGIFFGIIFGAATVYLALRAGLTVSASVPIAVLAIAVFKKLGKSTILENNIVQTIGSAGESVAAGVVFTMPALLFLAGGDDVLQVPHDLRPRRPSAASLGVLFMIPLRRALIVKEHGNLPYPEGTACADVLIAGEKGGDLAKMVFKGVGVALLYKFLYGILGLWNETATWFRTGKDGKIPDATLIVRRHARVPRPRLHHRAAHRRRARLGRRAVLARADPADLDLRARERASSQDLKNLGFTDAWMAEPLPRRVDLPRLRPLHRRRRGGLRGRHDAGQDAADDRLGLPRVGEVASARAATAKSDVAHRARPRHGRRRRSARSSWRCSSRSCRASRTARSRARS